MKKINTLIKDTNFKITFCELNTTLDIINSKKTGRYYMVLKK